MLTCLGYLPLLGQTIVGRTVERLASHPRVDEVVIAVSPDDTGYVAATLAVLRELQGGRGACQPV